LVGLAVLAWFLTASPYSGGLQFFRPYATASVLAAILCSGDAWFVSVLVSRPMRYIARTSYALYVLHPLTTFGWWNEGVVFERYFFKRPLGLLVTFLAAHVSTLYWERRWIEGASNWLEMRKMRRRQSAALLQPQRSLDRIE
jgi:peptidoglycan/LPS O-acetylase OafA/YrhL